MRLIDADAYKGKVICNHTYSGVKELINIDDVPTAYDVEKVEENLKGLREIDMCDLGDCPDELTFCHDCCSNRMLNKAIEIAQAGCVSDDCCEWEPHRNNYVTSCEEDFVPMMRGYKYCPYCGKKIKIVGD